MKQLINLSYTLLISLILTAFTFAQPPAPTPATDLRLTSLKSLPPTEKFTSDEGRFTIAMPKEGFEFEPTVPTAHAPKQTGGTYSWAVKEGVIVVGYADNPDVSIKTEKDYADMAEGMRTGIAGSMGAKIVSEGPLKLGEYRGYEIRYELPTKSKGISRMYIVGGRSYTLLSVIFPEPAGGMELAAKAMDSFALMAPAQPPEKTTAADKPVTSLKTLPANTKFTSAEGRFTIAMPKDTVELEAVTPSEGAPEETGGKFSWKVTEGVVIVDYSDDPTFVVKTEKDYAEVADGMKAGITAFGAKILSEKTYYLGKYRGYELKFEGSDKLKGTSRILIVDGRRYGIFGLADPGVAGAIDVINRALDSFELIPANPQPKSVPPRDPPKN